MKTGNNILNSDQIKYAIGYLEKDLPIILPTDTIYGLSLKYNLNNVTKINRIKSSNESKKLIVLISKVSQIRDLGVEVNLKQISILKSSNRPTTLLLKTKNEEMIGFRIPKRRDLKLIIDKVGPIISTSVNISGRKFLSNYDELLAFKEEKNINEIFWVGTLNNKPSIILDPELNIIRD
ncbi:L-threonylcarbamoyladenylate synthase [Spiroplasma corruscae]|uniref:L-threonylcarbamoyladenylate synthase n=1 Tax=Spiroplasma corruscae TaxID=216934 RepID=A0A222EQ81_9MOLU|nr:Sua5/YciO/YrdC/YwlC family protein [Spiroplasma corruscae]ASP28616.1 L-threonylcarbamoyladenylate synthase [Spiroplasma corruscae]